MRRIQYTLTALALLCILCCSVKEAMSYFTTYAEARGGFTVHLQEETKIHEDVSDWTKNLVIHNSDKNVRVYVRVKAFVGDAYKDTLTFKGDKWSKGEADQYGYDYYYYDGIVEPDNGENDPEKLIDDTTKLSIGFGHPEATEENDSFNVVVVYESTPVQYKDGKELSAKDADWTQKVKTVITEGGK